MPKLSGLKNLDKYGKKQKYFKIMDIKEEILKDK